jgi:DNA repair exonuclease SbcCD nuclease subunit
MMSKIVFLGDTHFGCRGDSQHFHEFFDKFYTTVFFPYLIENNIKHVIQLGDIFDRRKYSNHYTLDEAKRYFFSRFAELDIHLTTLLGNHDLFYKESLSISSSGLFLKQFKNVTVVQEPTRLLNGISIIPWICKENYQECLDFIKTDTSSVCVGHFEIQGFKMYQSSILSEHGLSAKMFSNYETVLSGHYHHASKRGNIEYIGTPYEMTWQDFGDPKGFRVFDLETRELDTVKNPNSIFYKMEYDDSGSGDVTTSSYLDTKFLSEVIGKYVKIQVKAKTNPYLFDLFVDRVYANNPIDVSITEDVVDLEIEEDVDETDDTLTITYKYIDSINQQELDKNKLKTMMSNLYTEAMAVE